MYFGIWVATCGIFRKQLHLKLAAKMNQALRPSLLVGFRNRTSGWQSDIKELGSNGEKQSKVSPQLLK